MLIAPSTCTRPTPRKLPSRYANVWPCVVSAARGFLPRYVAFTVPRVTVRPRWPSSMAAASPKCKVPLIASGPSDTCQNKTKPINTHFICERAALRRSTRLLRSDSKNNTSLSRSSVAHENPEHRTDRSEARRAAPRTSMPRPFLKPCRKVPEKTTGIPLLSYRLTSSYLAIRLRSARLPRTETPKSFNPLRWLGNAVQYRRKQSRAMHVQI